MAFYSRDKDVFLQQLKIQIKKNNFVNMLVEDRNNEMYNQYIF